MATARRIRVLVNPSAHSGRARQALARTGQHRSAADLHLEWIESDSAAHFRDLVRAAQDDDLDALAVAGGDGTVALALSALPRDNRVPLAVLPLGSGNDFARHLGIPRGLDGALGVLRDGTTHGVDVATAHPGGHRYGCVASVGLDELALRIVHGSRWPRCRALNVCAALRALWAYRPRPVRVTWHDGSFEGEIMFAAITNTRSYAGGFLVSPAARLDDGRLDLCIVRRTARARLLWHFPRIFKGTHGDLPEVLLASSPWVRVESLAEPLPVALDGELPQTTTPLELRCEPGGLRVLAPRPEGP
jgi:diacylglycerol kinase (ATP)